MIILAVRLRLLLFFFIAHPSFLVLGPAWVQESFHVSRECPPRISITLEDVVALALNFLVDFSPVVLGFSLVLVVDSSYIVALSLQLSEEQFVPLLGSLEHFASLAEFSVRLMLLLQYDIHGVVIRLLEVGNRGGVGFSRLRELSGVGFKQRVEVILFSIMLPPLRK